MDERLIQYIKKHVEKGFSTDRIRQVLLNAGHEANVVEEHIRHAVGSAINKHLIEYIQKNLEAGYPGAAIKQALLKAGYEINIVEKHIEHVLEVKRAQLEHMKKYLKPSPKVKTAEESIKHAASLKTRKKILTASIAIIAIIISVIGFYYFSDFNKKTEVKSESIVGDENKNLDLLNNALIKNDESLCNNIEDANLREQCKNAFTFNETCDEECENKKIFNLAIIKNNKSICIGIKDEKIKEDCNNIFDKPVVDETEKVCDEACKNQEFLNLALIKHNSSICLQISDSSLKDQCGQLFT